MSANEAAFVLRQRSSFESLDSGALLYRRFFVKLQLFFIPLLLMFAFLLRQIFPGSLWLSYVLLWWLKPVYDRVLLIPLGILFFDPEARTRDLLRNIIRDAGRHLIHDLTWRRFSPVRGLRLPVIMLEPGQKHGTRFEQLARRGSSSAGGMTAAMLFIEAALYFSGLVFTAYFINLTYPGFFESFNIFQDAWIEPALFWWYVSIIALVEPLYTAMGFSLYINVRVILEGWDLRIAFASLSQKRKKSKINPRVLGLILLLLIPCVPLNALQQGDSAQDALDQVYEEGDYGGQAFRWRIRLRDIWKSQDQQRESVDLTPFTPNLPKVDPRIAAVLRALVIGSVVGVLLFFGIRKFTPLLKFPKNGTTPVSLVEKEDLQKRHTGAADLYSRAWSCWKEQDSYGAWLFLYAACIRRIEETRGAVIDREMTEGETALYLKKKAFLSADSILLFEQMVGTLRRVVYGHLPADRSFEPFAESVYAAIPGVSVSQAEEVRYE